MSSTQSASPPASAGTDTLLREVLARFPALVLAESRVAWIATLAVIARSEATRQSQ